MATRTEVGSADPGPGRLARNQIVRAAMALSELLTFRTPRHDMMTDESLTTASKPFAHEIALYTDEELDRYLTDHGR